MLYKASKTDEVIYDLLRRDRLATISYFKSVLMVLAGGMRGVFGAGQARALVRMGLHRAFDVVFGISTGAITAAYFLAGQSEVALRSYWDALATRRFISPFRGVRNDFISSFADLWHRIRCWLKREKFVRPFRKGAADIDWLERLIRFGDPTLGIPPLDQAALLAATSEFYVQVTTPEGKSVVLNVKECPDPIAAIIASAALPGSLYGKYVTINGRKYFDGALGNLFPVERVIRLFRPTHILVIPNRIVTTKLPVRSSSRYLGRVASWIVELFLLYTCPRGSTSKKALRKQRLRRYVWRSVEGLGGWLRRLSFRTIEYLVVQFLMGAFPRRLRRRVHNLRSRLDSATLRAHARDDVKVGILPWRDTEVGAFTTDPNKLREAGLQGELSVHLYHLRLPPEEEEPSLPPLKPDLLARVLSCSREKGNNGDDHASIHGT